MGCDIHVHIEVKVDGEWLHYAVPRVDRNYKLFTRMAGVRDYTHGEIEPIAKPRGLPPDVSRVTQVNAKRWNADGHNHSWLGADELSALQKWYRAEFDPDSSDLWWWTAFGVLLFGNKIGSFNQYPDEYPPELEDVRAVFWFDN